MARFYTLSLDREQERLKSRCEERMQKLAARVVSLSMTKGTHRRPPECNRREGGGKE
jgi:hypothetical protein